MGIDISPLVTNLMAEEGDKTRGYDDANDNVLTKGYTIVGTPTVGVGHNLEVPLSQAAIKQILQDDIAPAVADAQSHGWFATLNQARQLAIVDMIFNLGEHTFDEFATFIGYLQTGMYISAANDLTGTAWYSEVGPRAARIASIISTGVWIVA